MKLPQVLFVTGKGGAGKSTVAAALAKAIAEKGPATLIELDEAARPQAIAREADARRDEPFERIALTARAELEAFITRIAPLAMIARRMIQSRTFAFVTAALPGLEAFLMLDRIRLMSMAEARTMVVDAPATGHALEMLSVAAALERLAPLGTLNRLARELKSYLQDTKRFGVILVTGPEELPVRETIAAAQSLRELGLRCAGVVLNGVSDALFSPREIRRLNALDQGHRRLAERRRAAAEAARRARIALRSCKAPIFELPTRNPAAAAGEPQGTAARLAESRLFR